MVGTLDFRAEGRWFVPGLCHCVVSFRQETLLRIISLFLGVHNTGGNPALDSKLFCATETGLSYDPVGGLWVPCGCPVGPLWVPCGSPVAHV